MIRVHRLIITIRLRTICVGFALNYLPDRALLLYRSQRQVILTIVNVIRDTTVTMLPIVKMQHSLKYQIRN